ncbi:hypothetical protein AXF42_Ash011752 [Apostasia shenzhenica]|uniref:Uncharacterized protein n=1 Tax=Apostasia shenzhenica TaxID=1088818 RepID=A0A2H9ZUW7_9ASPA|nr:hypothetical protein AXF42_Ash011752 [Apostasia shenzhenica]
MIRFLSKSSSSFALISPAVTSSADTSEYPSIGRAFSTSPDASIAVAAAGSRRSSASTSPEYSGGLGLIISNFVVSVSVWSYTTYVPTLVRSSTRLTGRVSRAPRHTTYLRGGGKSCEDVRLRNKHKSCKICAT